MKIKAKTIVKPGLAIYAGKSSQSDVHKHHAIQIALVIKGSYKLYIEEKILEGKCFLINSNVNHKHESTDGVQISIFIDPETDLGNLLTHNFSNKYHQFSTSTEVISKFSEEIFKTNVSKLNIPQLITQLFDLELASRNTDSRIDSLIQKINSCDLEYINLANLTQDIPLSSSRIRHLFKETTGISIQRFILWTKVKNAFNDLSKIESLSQIAYKSGFSDYSHMSRTIKEMFGLNLKTIFNDSHYVQDF